MNPKSMQQQTIPSAAACFFLSEISFTMKGAPQIHPAWGTVQSKTGPKRCEKHMQRIVSYPPARFSVGIRSLVPADALTAAEDAETRF